MELAHARLPPSIFNHSLRVYLYACEFRSTEEGTAEAKISVQPISAQLYVLFVACILHDIGTAAEYDADPARFEVVGADVAANLLRSHGTEEREIREAWLSIAVHTSPHIAERLSGLVRSVRLGVRADFGSHPLPSSKPPDHLVQLLPRLDIEKDLGDAVVRQVVERREKAPHASWPGDLLRAKEANPEWDGVNKSF